MPGASRNESVFSGTLRMRNTKDRTADFMSSVRSFFWEIILSVRMEIADRRDVENPNAADGSPRNYRDGERQEE